MSRQLDDRTLRSVSFRLKSTPVKQLPKILPHITQQLVASTLDLRTNSIDATWLKNRITSLLQDRTHEGRWSAVVLVKTVLDVQGSSALAEDKERMGAWVRALIDTLKRPGPVTTKKCAILTITRAFVLTWEHATLVREITTPALPTFITTCLQHFHGQTLNTALQSELAEYVLESFAQLLRRHHTVFRAFATQVRSLAIAAICNDPFREETQVVLSPELKGLASEVLVLLHQCAQKGGGAVEWESGINDLILSIHSTADQVFRAVSEDWQSFTGVMPTIVRGQELSDSPHLNAQRPTGFPAFTGLRSGVERLRSLLMMLQAYLLAPTAAMVKMPLGRIIDLLTRFLSIQVPRPKDPVGNRYNAQVAREERDELLALLPSLHVSTLDVVSVILHRLDAAAMPVCGHFVDLITWLFGSEQFDAGVRTASYRCTAQLLSITGPSMAKTSVRALNAIAQHCSQDLLPPSEEKSGSEMLNVQMTSSEKKIRGLELVAGHESTTKFGDLIYPGLYEAASELLPLLLTRLPTQLVSKATRRQIDRTAIFTKHTNALAASVLNPALQKASVLPILSATAPGSMITEALLRPRMPVIVSGKQEDGIFQDSGADHAGDGQDVEVQEEEPLAAYDESEPVSWSTQMTPMAADPIEPKIRDFAIPGLSRAIRETSPALPRYSSAKRGPSESGEATKLLKKPRMEEGSAHAGQVHDTVADLDEVVKSVPTTLATMTSEATASNVEDGTRAQDPQSEHDEGEDDGSDFEIPKLVMKSDSDDDVEEDDDED